MFSKQATKIILFKRKQRGGEASRVPFARNLRREVDARGDAQGRIVPRLRYRRVASPYRCRRRRAARRRDCPRLRDSLFSPLRFSIALFLLTVACLTEEATPGPFLAEDKVDDRTQPRG